MKDLVYIYDKVDFTRSELGEIQRDFNLSFVIDGTKDSAKVIVINHSSIEVEPYSIVKHRATNTWWVVSHDKVIRYANDNNTYLYTHELELLGAIELLNARDLTDSGFNQNRYNIGQFFARVLKHSNFEFKSAYTLNAQDNIDLNKNIDYVKTFENYTPLSAIREFIDGYNCAIKLDFVENNSGTITSANFYIVSKSGNINGTTWDENDFNEVQETKTLDKNSFGTSVISNAENVISTKTKTYPTVGGVRLSANQYKINGQSAVLRLPSNVFRVNNILMGTPIGYIAIGPWSGVGDEPKIPFNPFDKSSMVNAIAQMRVLVNNIVPNALSWYDETFNVEKLQEDTLMKLYNEEDYDPISKTFITSNQMYVYSHKVTNLTNENRTLFLSNKELRDNVEKNTGGIYYERNKNIISGFEFFQRNDDLTQAIIEKDSGYYEYNDNGAIYEFYVGNLGAWNSTDLEYPTTKLYNIYDMCFIVNYTPMSDIKIKVDNNGEKLDSQLFNQNGKLTDSVALSKRLLSYSKEIESDTITKYGAFYVKNENGTITNNIPKVGDLVSIGNNVYVINNVGLDFFENEVNDTNTDINYYVRAEFTMSKNVAVKSLMVNPNKNIRDYGIPQNNNVKRKQLYRDFYELGHSQESSDTTWYQPLPSVLNISNQYDPYQEHIAVIKLTYYGSYGGTPSNTWYYQLESTTYVMKKMVYEVIDFKDNNIIGYGSQNVWCGFDITRVFKNQIDYISTPISYVDTNGEFVGITMALCNGEQITNIYDSYEQQEANAHSTDYSNWNKTSLYNYSVFIPSDIYENATYGAKVNGNHDFIIEESDYEKDALEVPVFEYVCQIDDSEQVVVGDNILDTYQEDNAYLYSYVFVNKNKYNNNNYGNANIGSVSIDSNNIATLNNAVKLEYSGNSQVKITLYNSVSYNLETKTATYGNQVAFDTNSDLMIIRHRILEEDLYREVVGELIDTNIHSSEPSAISDYYGKYYINTNDNYYKCQTEAQATVGELLNDNTNYYYYSADKTNIPKTTTSNINKSVAVKVYTAPTPNDSYVITGGTNASGYPYGASDTPYHIYGNFDNNDNMPSAVTDRVVVAEYRLVDEDYVLATTSVPEIYDSQNPSSVGISGSGSQRCVTKRKGIYDTYNGNEIRLATTNIYNNVSSAETYLNGLDLDLNGYFVLIGLEFYLVNGSIYNYYLSATGKPPMTTYWYHFRGSSTNYTYNNINYSFDQVLYMYKEWQYSSGSWIFQSNFPSGLYRLYNTNNFYYWGGISFIQYTTPPTYRVVEIRLYLYNGSSWTDISTNHKYHQLGTSNEWFSWDNNVWTKGTLSEEWHWFTGSIKTQPFADSGTLTNEIFSYGIYYYQWNGSSWTDITNFEWVEIGNANNEYFTYNNTLYKYNATTNVLEQISSDTSINREDLMFIVRDMEDSNISSNILTLYINYFKTN